MTTRSIRYQLLLGTIDRPPYIPPIPTSSDYGGLLILDETLITDDPHYCTMGWLAELGKQALIKMTNDQVDALYEYMYPKIYNKWYTFVSNDRKGYKFGLVAMVDRPQVLRNYDWSNLQTPTLKSINDGIATIAFERWYRNAGIAKWSRTKVDIYDIKLLEIDRYGNLLSIDKFKAYFDANGDYVKLDYVPAY